MKLSKLLVLLALGTMPVAFGSVYVSDFSGASVGDPLGGVDGWTQSEANNDDASPLSWINEHDGSKAGAIGGYYDTPVGSSYYVNHSIGQTLIGSTLSMNFGIMDSTNSYPARNNFSFAILNGSTDLFTLHFIATSQTTTPESEANAQWNMNWSSNGSTSSDFAGVLEGGAYTYDVSFAALGLNDVEATFTVSGTSTYTETVTLTGFASQTFADLRVTAEMGTPTSWGDNFIAFQGVPEPSAAMLVLFSALGLLRRRR